MSNGENTNMSLDDLLDGTLDDLSDIPTFKPFAAGAHVCKIKWALEKINEVDAVKLKLTHVSTEELANPDDVAPVAGDTTEVAFMLKKKDGSRNELSEGQWKEILASLKAAGIGGEGATNRQVMDASNDMEVLVVTNVRKNDKDKNDIKYYTGVKSVSVI